MIVRERPGLLPLFFIMRGSIVPRILPQIIVIFVMSCLITWGHHERPGMILSVSGVPFAVLGTALSVFLSFRNNACYQRWWEARHSWGQLVYAARTFSRQTLLLEALHGEEGRRVRRSLLTLAMAMPHALVQHLRPEGDQSKVERLLPDDVQPLYHAASNRPEMLMRLMSADLARMRASDRITDIQYQMLDRTITDMAIVPATCERIRNTPLPFAYTLLVHRTAYLFCFLMPFGSVDVLGWGTPFAAAVIAYTFFGLDALGDELENPFSKEANALPIGALADAIEHNLREAMGETDLPPLPTPTNFVLM
ncbi:MULTISPECIES: bestrophin family protein [Rhizobium]|uniref:Bestrophin family protein n=1 Tax=Rhizobium rhododendri TaxID=2506430 RepID=A0ABY8IEM6_9HYPH|nr:MULTISPECIES: bestrophin family protein [Rhizobium]MBZ5759269.1 bestrophin family protein [Rhizobium sp. VS19-DR96]MBZ5763900.1 bestrophin family protein [Rhizobium sp. VS19-DR129.2]MBZ5771444.1 bestrophin family protein [Rhizobium sp. VS19-DRK62.2]MBZ5783869.1 bestrophin family protein [Rhizobium sp. VS19-DR121]MBZ5801457.1 bestrophin family protein [Rhizobium sp. VS19-DR181]